ncbi:MAG: hypothetical protein EOO29_12070 [Comamonadaceae bacterium]|nr:MAG: hypothetical protein EOO29_12070 [Comamonadaceae bacterium]
MTDSAPTSADLTAPPRNPDQDRIDISFPDNGPASRFGEAAHLLDRLDLRPQDQRQSPRPWWRIW